MQAMSFSFMCLGNDTFVAGRRGPVGGAAASKLGSGAGGASDQRWLS